jgi:uncharacterized protein (TIGR02118 family)
MFQLVALYHHPDDPAAFDQHYAEVHVPLASKIPGLQRYTYVRPGPDPQGNQPAYYLIATLDFESGEALGAGMASPDGQAAAADLANFATGGVTLLTGPATLV